MNPDERFADLWTDYLEGELDESGIAELQELLADGSRLESAVGDYEVHRLLGLGGTWYRTWRPRASILRAVLTL